MIPVHFGHPERLLYGAYTPAMERRKRRGVVICNPWGGEALRAHRSLRFLAERLGQAGLDVLRFDYSGTGDSFGEGTSATLAAWVEDAELAMDELMAMAGVRRTSMVGLRLGTYVAAAAAARRPDAVDRVVLWEPVLHGSQHFAELTRAAVAAPTAGVVAQVGGFPLTARFRDEVDALSLDGLPGAHCRVLVVQSPSGVRLDPGCVSGREVTVVEMDALPCWIEEHNSGAGALPVTVLTKVAEWLT